MKKIHHVKDILLGSLLTKAKELVNLNHLISSYLDPAIQAHCHVANYRAGLLVLEVTSSTFATLLRYQVPELRDKLRKQAHLHELVSIKICVQDHHEDPKNHRPQQKACLSTTSRKHIKEMAGSVKDPELQEALLRLADGARGRSRTGTGYSPEGF